MNKKHVKIKPPKPHPRIKLRSPEIPSAGRIKKRWPISKGEYKGSYQSYKGGKENRRGSKRRKGAPRSRSRVCWNPVWDPGKRERSAPRGSWNRAYLRTIRVRQVGPKNNLARTRNRSRVACSFSTRLIGVRSRKNKNKIKS